jgi:hypothetical protein
MDAEFPTCAVVEELRGSNASISAESWLAAIHRIRAICIHAAERPVAALLHTGLHCKVAPLQDAAAVTADACRELVGHGVVLQRKQNWRTLSGDSAAELWFSPEAAGADNA